MEMAVLLALVVNSILWGLFEWYRGHGPDGV